MTYWLEDVDVDGTRTLHGPIAPSFEVNAKQSRAAQSEMLGEAQRKAETTGTTFRSWAADFAEQQKELLTPPVLTGNKPPLTQAQIAASPGLKIGVTRTGWYRVSQAEMLAAGFNQRHGTVVTAVPTRSKCQSRFQATARSPVRLTTLSSMVTA